MIVNCVYFILVQCFHVSPNRIRNHHSKHQHSYRVAVQLLNGRIVTILVKTILLIPYRWVLKKNRIIQSPFQFFKNKDGNIQKAKRHNVR